MRVAFRTDASVQIGTGHVMRCLTLADELTRQGHECWFVCREHDGHLGDLIASKGYDLTLLPSPGNNEPDANDRNSENYALWLGVPQQDDARQTLGPLKAWKPDWLVVDHYALDAQWERSLANAAGKIMVIDDLANRPHECALLLDQNLGRQAEDYCYLVPECCQVLAGPRYALLRPEFREWREASLSRRARQPRLQRLLINLGGVDKDNVTGQVLEALITCDLPADLQISVVMGASAPWRESVAAQARVMPWSTEVVVNVSDMARRMTEADLAIGAAGSTSWERCCLGLPTLMVVLADNQEASAKAMQKIDAANCIGQAAALRDELPAKLEILSKSPLTLKSMTVSSAAICDGSGAPHVAKIFLNIMGE